MSRLLMVACGLALVACQPVNLVVVDVPDGGEFHPPAGASCARSDDCMAGQFCEKAACGDALGNCAQRPLVCPGEGPPECGCDGVTYWNRCLRERAGVEADREHGPCRNPRACDTTTPCPDGYCARLVFPNECGRVVSGACWVLPDVACTGPGPTFNPCGGAPQCVRICDAIMTEQPMAERMRGLPCP